MKKLQTPEVSGLTSLMQGGVCVCLTRGTWSVWSSESEEGTNRRWGGAVGISLGTLILTAIELIAFEQAHSGSDLHF